VQVLGRAYQREASEVARLHEYCEAGKARPLGVVLTRGRISEIREHTVAQILGDHAAQRFDFVGATGVNCSDNIALLFRIETGRERA
jgi:hypothetical protein